MTTATVTQDQATETLAALPTLRLCTAGSVDDGKSTFVGRLLHDTKSILADQLESVERASTAKGLSSPDLSLLVDGLRAEREQGITIDVAYRYFASDRRSFILADTPGHVQYTRNTVTGLSTSDLVVILIDARNGVIEQTRRHLSVAAMLDIPQVVVAVNKIDTVDYSEDVFNSVREDVNALVGHLRITFGEQLLPRVDVVPISALHGDNVVDKSENTPWYQGDSVLTILENAQVSGAYGAAAGVAGTGATDTGTAVAGPAAAPGAATTGFRLPVQYVIRDHATDYRGYAGRITAGEINVGDKVQIGPLASEVIGIDTPDGPQPRAFAGQSVTLRLADNVDIARGDVLSDASLPQPTNQFSALAFHLADAPVAVGANVLLRYGPAEVRAKVLGIEERVDILSPDAPRADEDIAHGQLNQLALNDIARIRVAVAEPLPVEPYRRGGGTGAFLLLNPTTGDTVTAGLVAGADTHAGQAGA